MYERLLLLLSSTIDIYEFVSVSPDKGIAALFLVLRTVEELKLKRLKHVTGKGLQSTTSKTLRSVNLRESSSFSDVGVKALVMNCPNIEELNLSELHKLTDAAVVAVAESLRDRLVSEQVN